MLSNFPLNSSINRATSPLFSRYKLLGLYVEKINRRREGGGHRSMSTHPKYATDDNDEEEGSRDVPLYNSISNTNSNNIT